VWSQDAEGNGVNELGAFMLQAGMEHKIQSLLYKYGITSAVKQQT
jgi:hypothetical protein